MPTGHHLQMIGAVQLVIVSFCLNVVPLFLGSQEKKRTVALSSCEAEYMALSATIQEALHLVQLLKDVDCAFQYGPQ